ncbi:MBOAT family protein [Sinanaerobacter sp. ZZT-01]|uniref:MBOAT family O-acyltransferase n=1 Tax=Sinanaerobacter sp. ZZT-01 TaxID=3111540 RepID=UPI002D79F8E4|nr:MBOAT family protein [Sinanaerobacter sp. ZZT-01]WRR94956.1 MBOAT family protein [Sinanaerobacter sp. ZZT-01]
MLFSSIVFLFYFFPVVFVLYYVFSFSRRLQNIWLLISSLVFYAWGEPVYVFLMLASILFNSLMGYLVERRTKAWLKHLLLVVAVTGNLSVLFVFKYLQFILDMIMPASFKGFSFDLPLPIGISFFTFQALSYVVDVYRGTTRSENPFYVGLYISFFPQLIAGPIIQYNSIAEQIRNRKSSIDKISLGICRFTTGLGKKVLLSNCVASIADNVFQWSAIGTDKMTVPVMLAWLGSIAYTLQIYFDFSAYSDMAIGLGLCFGFKFKENFNYPYIAVSVSDFWRRWHISLTSWFREYVYFPLGGNKVRNQDKMVRNIFIVWLLTGIWHGANWTFIFWGLYYFIFQLAERFFEYPSKIKNNFLKHFYTLMVVSVGWVVFRADDLYQAGRFFMNMLGLNHNGFYSELAVMLIHENWVFLLMAVIFCMPIARNMNQILYQDENSRKVHIIFTFFYPLVLLSILIVSVCYLASGTYNPFIYFNF